MISTLFVMMLSGPLVRAQQPREAPQPIFRADTRLIVENVVVKDKSGNPVQGLTAKDFTVTEDGVPQAISFVEFQRLIPPTVTGRDVNRATAPPPSATDAAAIPHISATPDGAVRYRDRRLLVLYFDLTAMPPGDQMRAYA